MPVQQYTGSNTPYLSIIAGSLRQTVTPETPEAVKREYEGKDKTMKTKYELIHKSVSGRILDLEIKSTDFGEFLNVVFSDFILSVNVESKYFKALVSKLAGIDINQEVVLAPFDYEEGKDRFIGMSVKVGGEKAKNYFYNDVDKTYCNGWPVPAGDTSKFKKADWTIFYIGVTKFLVEQVEKIKATIGKVENTGESLAGILEKKASEDQESTVEEMDKEVNDEISVEVEETKADDEIRLEDVPF